MKKGWVVSSFGMSNSNGLKNNDKSTATNRKRVRKTYPKANGGDSDSNCDEILWINKYRPKTENELAVHKKKIEEVREWMLRTQNASGSKSKILLLSGPSGSGKTATVWMLSNELNFGIKEWSNSNGLNYVYDQRVFGESQVSTFKDFLLLTSKYSANQIFKEESKYSKYVILLEEFPTFIFKNVEEFQDILRNYSQNAVYPLILIVTDDNKDSFNERKLLPESFQDELGIENISFNQIATTNLNRCLNRIADSECLAVPPESIESITCNSHGDVRAAINALQFTYDTANRPVNKMKSKSRRKPTKTAKLERVKSNVIGARDESLFLLHALGKILHCKRAEIFDEKLKLPPTMNELERRPLVTNPEEVWQRTSTSVNNYLAFLHQNYVPFVNKIKNLEMSSAYISFSDMLDAAWTGYDIPKLDQYIFSVASRGIMFCSTEEKVGWKPLNKPQSIDVGKANMNNMKHGKSIFKDSTFGVSMTELFSEIIPYISKIRPKDYTADQINFADHIEDVRGYKPFRKDSEFSDRWDKNQTDAKQYQNEPTKQISLEEFDIEEFED